MQYIDADRVDLHYVLPLAEIIYDFFDTLKSRTRGYASFDYELKEYVQSNLVKLDIMLNGEVVDADNVYVNPQVVNSENVKVGDIVVVVRNGSRSLIGKHAQIKTFMPNTVIGAFMTGIRSESPKFTNALLNTSRFEEEIAMNMGATINQITGYMFSKMEFKVPCLDEQKEIGEYFENLDHLITLHQRKLDEMKKHKKALMLLLLTGIVRVRL